MCVKPYSPETVSTMAEKGNTTVAGCQQTAHVQDPTLLLGHASLNFTVLPVCKVWLSTELVKKKNQVSKVLALPCKEAAQCPPLCKEPRKVGTGSHQRLPDQPQ